MPQRELPPGMPPWLKMERRLGTGHRIIVYFPSDAAFANDLEATQAMGETAMHLEHLASRIRRTMAVMVNDTMWRSVAIGRQHHGPGGRRGR